MTRADRIERETESRIAFREWTADACTPAANQTAVLINDGQRLHCTLYSRATPGLAREVVSASVIEVAP